MRDAFTLPGTKRHIDRSGVDGEALLHEAFGNKTIWFWKIAIVVMKQMGAHPHRNIFCQLKSTKLKSARRLSIEDGSRRMKAHALLERCETVGSRKSRHCWQIISTKPIGFGYDSSNEVM